MRVLVLIKQVPDTAQVEIDPQSGNLRREKADTKVNLYDLYALETALSLKTEIPLEVIAMTMGPPQAGKAITEALMLGADRGILVCDKAFAGSDVLATSFTLAQAILTLGSYDLIVCGKQTTDGDTAQVGPALAEQLRIPQATLVSKVLSIDKQSIVVRQDGGELLLDVKMEFPCLITIEKGSTIPRLPSYLRKKRFQGQKVVTLALIDLADQNPSKYGNEGSPTRVQRIFPPTVNNDKVMLTGSADELAAGIVSILHQKKYRQGNS